MTRERPTRKNWSESDLDTCTISWTSREKVGNCQTACPPQLKFDPFTASNRHEKCLYGKYEFKAEKQAKLVPTAECYGLDALETVKTSTVETSRNDELPEDLWPNLSAMVTRLQQLYIGSHEEKLSAREHGFDRDFWAGSPSDRTSKLYRVHVKPRSSMFDPRLQETRSRRVAQLEHKINDDKNLWSGVVEGSKWIGVSAFHLSIAVTPLVMRTGKDRETGTGYSKPFVQPKRRPRDVSWSHPPSRIWEESEAPQAHWNWDEHQRQETLQKNDIRMSSPKQTVQSKQLPEPGVASALSDEGDSGNVEGLNPCTSYSRTNDYVKLWLRHLRTTLRTTTSCLSQAR